VTTFYSNSGFTQNVSSSTLGNSITAPAMGNLTFRATAGDFFIPALVSGIEGLVGGRSGSEKKDAAMPFLENALATVDAIAPREMVNPEQFRSGISKIIDGTVTCLNASTWAQSGAKSPNSSAASN
jgi:hypothetical protein